MNEKTEQKIELEKARLKGCVSHEEVLINNRMTWMLTIQGFLFAALALISQEDGKTLNIHGGTCNQMMCVFMDVIPVLGGVIALVVFFGVFAAYVSIDNTKHDVNENIHRLNEELHGSVVANKKAQQKNSALASMLGRIVSMSVPSAIVLTWFYLSWRINWPGSLLVGSLFAVLALMLLVAIAFKVYSATKSEPMKL